MPFFSVIIPTYNRLPLLKEALESVFSQTFTDYEIIVVDDGSTDGTLEMLRCYGKKIQLLNQKNSGPGAARNLGASVAKGEYLAFLDSDDIWMPWALETASIAIIENDFPAIVILKHQDFKQPRDLKEIIKEAVIISAHEDFLGASMRKGYTILSCSTAVIKNKEFKGAGGFSEQKINAEDLDLWMKLSNSIGFVEVLTPVCCGYRRHSESAVSNLELTYMGMDLMIKSEVNDCYPGGIPRSHERRKLISRYTRPASIALAKSGKIKLSTDLYIRTLMWNFNELRIKYIIGYLAILLFILIAGKHYEERL